jgi:hypothetical protein
VIYTFPELERCGRLANGLWQIASTLGIARARGGEPRFPSRWSYRPYFSVPDRYFSDESGAVSWELATHIDERVRRYLQDAGLWAHVADEVRTWFQPSPLATGRLLDVPAYHLWEGSVAIHVRRGDNVTQQEYFWLPTVEYFQKAVAMLPVDAPLAIFSDDPDWCSQVLVPALAGRATTVVRGAPRKKEHEDGYWNEPILDWIDFFCMVRMRYHVASNSTYSWWAAWLSRDPDPILPALWYSTKLSFVNTSLMFPSNWRCTRL